MAVVSIIIPCYDVEKYIMNCLRSVAAQTYTDYEVILVDDCGTDNTMKLVKEYLDNIINANVNKWRIIRHEKNRGLSAARNTGTEAAEGKYVYYLDSDDTIKPNCLQQLVCKAELSGSEIVVGNINILDNVVPMSGLKIKGNDDVLSGNNIIFYSYLNDIFNMMAWNKLVRRDFLERNKISFVEGLIHEDCAWSFTMACVAKKIAFVHEETYNYLVRSNSIQTGKDFTKHFDAYCTLLRYYADEAMKYGKADDSAFRWWYERQKAFHFRQTKDGGTKEQLRKIYDIIRENLPLKGWNKMQVHYCLPSFLGVLAYKKWCGMWLM